MRHMHNLDNDVQAIDYAALPPSGSAWRASFTVVAVVLGFIGAACFCHATFSYFFILNACVSKTSLARRAVCPTGTIATALKRFRHEQGRYPTQLIELATTPIGGGDGEDVVPYLDVDLRAGFQDPWGSEYRFRHPSQRSKQPFDLWSCGPDGTSGTDDDLTNW